MLIIIWEIKYKDITIIYVAYPKLENKYLIFISTKYYVKFYDKIYDQVIKDDFNWIIIYFII